MLCYLLTILGVSYASLPSTRTIYMTSDDGPLRGTRNLINVILSTNTPITMFMVGLHYDNAGQDLKNFINQARKSSHIDIANHSYTHANNHYRYFYHDTSHVVQDLKKNNITLGLTGNHISTRLPGRDVFRIPNLKRDDPYITKAEDMVERIDDDAVYRSGFYIYGWDLEWAHDMHGRPIQSVTHLVQEIENKFNSGDTVLPNKLILLMHDEMFQEQFSGPEQLQQLIDSLRKRGYKFDLIKNYYGCNS